MAQRRFELINAKQPTASVNVQNGNYTLISSDAGKIISKRSGGAGETITIPAEVGTDSAAFSDDAFDTDAFDTDSFSVVELSSDNVDFAIGTMIAIENSGGGNLTISINSDSLIWAKDGSTGSRTLADKGVAMLMKVNSAEWKIAGDGLT